VKSPLTNCWRPGQWCLLMACVALAGGMACDPPYSLGPIEGPCALKLAEDVYAHGCLHGRRGPFSRVALWSGADSGAPPVDRVQTVFELKRDPFTAEEGSSWSARYSPSRQGLHAIFHGADPGFTTLTVHTSAGDVVQPVAISPVPSVGRCGLMREVTGFELDKGESYFLRVETTSDAVETVQLFFEHPESFGRDAWRTECGE